jgi:hypothetical protein
MKRSFFQDCMLFKSKELLHKYLGVFLWLNVLQVILVAIDRFHESKTITTYDWGRIEVVNENGYAMYFK